MKKLIIFLLAFLFAVTAHATMIISVPQDKNPIIDFFSQIWKCKWRWSCYHPLGATITTIAGTDTISSSRSTINTNFSNLNAYKIENSTTSVASITTLSNLATIGTITSGTWNGTTISAANGGTGSTTLSTNQVLLGNGISQLKTVTGFGTSGQFLTSNGASSAPTWQSASVDQTANYTWSGNHTFTASTTFTGNPINIASATTTLSNTNPIIAIGTSTPAILRGVANVYNSYIAGGLGVGTATTSSGNLRVSNYLQIDGTASTTGLIVSNTSTLPIYSTTSAGVVCSTTGGQSCSQTVYCLPGDLILAGGFNTGMDNSAPLNMQQNYNSASDRWYVQDIITANSNAHSLTVYGVCLNQ